MAKPLPTGPNFEKLLSSNNSQAAAYMKQQRQMTQSRQPVQQTPGALNPIMGQGLSVQWPPQSQWDRTEHNVF